MKGLFITLEGPDGCGKTTHAKSLFHYIKEKRLSVILTREPGGIWLGESIRKIMLSSKYSISPLSELFLIEASRVQHTQKVIIPALKKGKIVICERYTDATLSYQGYGRGIEFKVINILNKIASFRVVPDLTILLDVDVEEGLRRIGLVKTMDRIEKESISFHRRVRNGYLAIAKKFPQRIKTIKTNSINSTQKKIRKEVDKLLKRKNLH